MCLPHSIVQNIPRLYSTTLGSLSFRRIVPSHVIESSISLLVVRCVSSTSCRSSSLSFSTLSSPSSPIPSPPNPCSLPSPDSASCGLSCFPLSSYRRASIAESIDPQSSSHYILVSPLIAPSQRRGCILISLSATHSPVTLTVADLITLSFQSSSVLFNTLYSLSLLFLLFVVCYHSTSLFDPYKGLVSSPIPHWIVSPMVFSLARSVETKSISSALV